MRLRSARIFLPVLFIALMCAHSVVALHRLWTDWDLTTLAHGYLVAGVSAWLLWRNTHRIPPQQWQPDLRALPVLFVLALGWLFSTLAGLQSIELLLLPPLFAMAIHLSFGGAVSRRSTFAVAYLWFAMPGWDELAPGLQWITVHVTRALLRLSGIPSHLEGQMVHLPSGSFEIEPGCSGLHFFVVALVIAALLGELRGDGWRRRLKLLAVAALLALVANWIRVFVVVLAGHLTHMQHPLVVDSHYGFGWGVFAVCLLLFLLIERRIADDVQSRPVVPRLSGQNTWPMAGLVATAIVAIAFTSWHRLAIRPYAGEWAVASAPDGWQEAPEAPLAWQPQFAGIDSQRLERWEASDSGSVDRYVGLYRFQTQGKEFSGYANRPRGAEEPVNSRFAQAYRVDGAAYSSAGIAQLVYAVRALVNLRAPASQVQVLRSDCEPDCEAAERRLSEWRD
jgi:exosortase A